MKKKLTLIFVFVSLKLLAQNSALKHHTVREMDLNKVIGYMEHLPPGYKENPTKKYPLIVFLHGLGQRSNEIDSLYRVAERGPSKEVEENGSLCFEVDGKQECFIVISPLRKTDGNWTGYAQEAFWDHILNGPDAYRYDPKRIYLTGWSLGGNGCYERAYSIENSDNKLAAIAPFGAWGNESKGCIIADRKIAVWAFHGTDDDVINFNGGERMFNAVNNCPSNVKTNKFSELQGVGHYKTEIAYTSDNTYYTPNLYQWLLTQKLGDDNDLPIVDAGFDKEVEDDITSVDFVAQASDSDGYIATYLWSQKFGPTATLSGIDTPSLTVSDLTIGTYVFKIEVTDDQGGTASDTVTLTVKSSIDNAPPIVDAGNNQSVELGTTDRIFLNAIASDSDGAIVSYQWEKVSGPFALLWNPDRSKLTVKDFVEGSYIFRITVTDDDGATASDTVEFIATGNSSGVASVYAGEDQTVIMGTTDRVFFNATTKAEDGVVVAYQWEKLVGPSAKLWNPDRSKLTVKDFVEGSYEFQVTVTFEDGDSASDTVKLDATLNSAPVSSNFSDNANLAESISPNEDELNIRKDFLINSRNQIISIKSSYAEIVIYSLQGNIVRKSLITDSINLNDLKNGLYIYQINDLVNKTIIYRGKIVKVAN